MFVDLIKFSVYFYKNFLTRFLISWSTPSKIKTNRTQKYDSYKKKRIKTGGHLIICLEEHIAHIVHIDYLVKILMEKYDTTRFSKRIDNIGNAAICILYVFSDNDNSCYARSPAQS